MSERPPKRKLPTWAAATLVVSLSMHTLNMAGWADTIIAWRDFFATGVLAPYSEFKMALIEALPWRYPAWIFDMFVVNGVVAAAVRIARLQFGNEAPNLDTRERVGFWTLIIFFGWAYFALILLAGAYVTLKLLLAPNHPAREVLREQIGIFRTALFAVLMTFLPLIGLILVASDLLNQW